MGVSRNRSHYREPCNGGESARRIYAKGIRIDWQELRWSVIGTSLREPA